MWTPGFLGPRPRLPQQFVIVFEPVTHSAQFLDVKGEPTRERQNLTIVFNKVSAPSATLAMRPGPLRLSLENRTDVRVPRSRPTFRTMPW